MKLHYTYLLLLIALLLYGCIDEEVDPCPSNKVENSLQLNFVYTDGKQPDIFNEKIERVHLYIYDIDEQYVKKKRVDKSELTRFAGTHLNLSPGIYRVVCWGNAADKTTLYKPAMGRLFKDAHLLFGQPDKEEADSSVATGGGDALYYALTSTTAFTHGPFVVTIPRDAEKVKTATINFGSAHMQVEVYIKGFEDKTTDGNLLLPLVELTAIPAGYNFDMKPLNRFISYRDKAAECIIEGEPMCGVDFSTPLIGTDTPARVVIKRESDGTTLTNFSLSEFIRDNDIDIINTPQPIVPILVEFTHNQVSVDISLPKWDYEDVEVEYVN